MSEISRLDQRKIEAALLGRMYAELCERYNQDEALVVIRAAVEKESFAAGQEFAKTAPGEPSLEHFLTITESWVGSGALDLGEVSFGGQQASFPVIRCRYVEIYREMGLPEELIPTLSCIRDEPFAKGYSARLSMQRDETLAGGNPACTFKFIWK